MPTYPLIEQYYADLARLIEFGGSDHEQNIRPAFLNCLRAYCHTHRERLELVPELRTSAGIIPDGTVTDTLRMPHGYWEAKDSHDDLDAEIQNKFNSGYPRDNILFEDSKTAVLFQRGRDPMRVDMSHPEKLHDLIRHFLDYELPQIEDFRTARDQFKVDLPAILGNLRETIEKEERTNFYFQEAAARFLNLCRQSIGPSVIQADVREMLIQHIITKDIFLRVFGEDQFHRENNVARELDALEGTFFTGDVRRAAIGRLRTYYGAIGRAADEIVDYLEKQQFLKGNYEDIYRIYNPKAADRMGVVYTPNEVVDFIIRGTDWLLHKHFGRRLADNNVQILDPATGTGTFVTNLINYLPFDRLEYKYLNEIHANELAILPYYTANLNIEYTFKERVGKYLEFPNLCFVDTLDNLDWEGATGAVQRQGSFNLGAISDENWYRIVNQNDKPISVIMGNPPYNANQQNENDNNKNREYPEIDKRISDTYVLASTAQKTKQYDMYKRFIRWASDRLADDGIIGFVSNNAFLDARQDDGFRKVVSEEFNELWVVDLKGNARTSGERRRREKGNIFDDKIRVGVAIYFLVRRQGAKGFKLFHNAVGDYLESSAKAAYIRGKTLSDFDFSEITPDADGNWLDQSNSNFDKLLPLANRDTKRAERVAEENALFKLTALGVNTARDEWVYSFDILNLRNKALFFADKYNQLLMEGARPEDTSIKWSAGTRSYFDRGVPVVYNEGFLTPSLYRPFVKKNYFADPMLSDRLTRYHREMFNDDLRHQNRVINWSLRGLNAFTMASNVLTDWHFTGDTQCFPLYRYTPNGERVCNITDWGLNQITDHYRKALGDHYAEEFPSGITPEDVFAYTYAVLHDPVYRHDYEVDLKREFPRLPLYKDFNAWARMGQELLDLHIGFESADPYPLERVDTGTEAKRTILRADKDSGRIVLDDVTTLTGVPADAWRYVLGSRSSLEWVLDQYKERKPKDPTIAEKFNTYRFADYKEHVIDLLRRVCTVSVRTMDIVDGMAYWDGDNLVVFGDRERDDWSLMGLEAMFSRPEDPAWEAEWSEI